MSTLYRYTVPLEETQWKFPASGEVAFTWDYDARSDELLGLYAKGKKEQWDSDTRIDWSLAVDPEDPMQMAEEVVPLYGTALWNKLSPKQHAELRYHSQVFNLSQFLHGEQGALVCAARIVQDAPRIEAKFYAATQVMDEARHVAFGRLALRDYYPQLTDAERREREEFVIEGSTHLRDRFNSPEMWERLGMDWKDVGPMLEQSEGQIRFRKRLFSRIVPTVRDIGLWSDRVQQAYTELGGIQYANTDAQAMLDHDAKVAEEFDKKMREGFSATPK